MLYGYLTGNGYYGMVDGQYILFATEEEYFEFLEERKNDDDKE